MNQDTKETTQGAKKQRRPETVWALLQWIRQEIDAGQARAEQCRLGSPERVAANVRTATLREIGIALSFIKDA